MHAKFFYGIRQALHPGQQVAPVDGYIYFSPNLDAAIWTAELTDGDDAPRIYEVAVSGPTENAEGQADYAAPPHPAMS